jgi:hypothetical protein
MVNDNIEFYLPKSILPETSLCEMVETSIPSINVLECSDTVIDLFKDGINYTLHINNEVLVGVTIINSK